MTMPVEKRASNFTAAFLFFELLYHSIVREVRTKSGNAPLGIFREVMQILSFFIIFYALFSLMGRSVAIRGDFVLFLFSGIFLLIIHTGAIGAVSQASTSVSQIMQHRPMSVMLSILAKSFAILYMQLIAIAIIAFFIHFAGDGLVIDNPKAMIAPLFFTWSSGMAIGILLLLLKPLAPSGVKVLTRIYMRAQMVTSGKFLPAAYMPAYLVGWFDWNPLFHTIDQMRLAIFVNYSREVSSMSYPVYFTLVVLVIGMMGEFWARKNLSKSKHEVGQG